MTTNPGSPGTGTGQQQQQQAQPIQVFMPAKPKMGDLQQTGGTDHVPWVGGKPKNDWSALEKTPNIVKPTMLRPTSAGSSQKSQAYRIAGLDEKFGHGSNLLEFQGDVMKHFERYGLDTITYVQDPADSSQMISIVDHHTKFTNDTASTAVRLHVGDYDAYDKANVEDAQSFVENSLTKDLAKELTQATKNVDNFVDYWMRLMEIVHIPSCDHFDDVKKVMRSRKLTDYAGENVVLLAQDYSDDYDKLHDAGLYDHNLTLVAIKAIMQGGGTGTESEEFRSPLRAIRKRLDAKLLEIRYDSYQEAHRKMVSDDLHLASVLRQCKAEYRKAIAGGYWPAATHAKDSKALPRDYGSVNKAEVSTIATLTNLVNALVRRETTDGSKANAECYNCGEKGHYSRNCPKPARKGGKNNRGGKGGGGNPKKKGRGRRGGASSPPPPKPGESEIRTINGVKKYWCQKCERWTISHGTDGHKTKEELSQIKPQANAVIDRVSFDLHPVIYKASLNTCCDEPAPAANDNDSWWQWIGAGLWIGLMMTLVHAVSYSPSATLSFSTAGSTLLDIAAMGALQAWTLGVTYWQLWLEALAAGLIGFGTLHRLYSTLDPAKRGSEDGTGSNKTRVRMRKGPNFQKKMLRRFKKANRTTKRGTRRPMRAADIPEDPLVRQAYHHSPQYARLGRSDILEAPVATRIRMVESVIQTLEEEIVELERKLVIARRRLRNRKAELYSLRRQQREQYRTTKPRSNGRFGKNKHRSAPLEDVSMALLDDLATNLARSSGKAVTKGATKGATRSATKRHGKDATDRVRGNAVTTFRRNIARSVKRNKEYLSKPKVNQCVKKSSIAPEWSMFHPVKVNWDVPKAKWCNSCRGHSHSSVECVKSASKPRKCGRIYMVDVTSIDSSTGSVTKHQVLFDTGANCCITFDYNDFVGPVEHLDNHKVDGIGKGLKATARGFVAWTFIGNNGVYRTIKLPCYLVPGTQERIASASVFLKEYPNEHINVRDGSLEISGDVTQGRPGVKVPFCGKTDLPFAQVFGTGTQLPEPLVYKRTKSGPVQPNVQKPVRSLTESQNCNLTDAEKELLRWHYRLGHIGMQRIQWLFRQGVLSGSERQRRLQIAASKLSKGTMCTACQYAKQRRRPEPGTVRRVVPTESGLLKQDQLFPGQRVSVDHFHASVSGRRLETYGKEPEDRRYVGGAIFVDHCSGYIYITLQSHLNSHETLKAKQEFERMCHDYGVVVQSYISDNGTAFRNAAFEANLKDFHQHLRAAAAGGHHSNGVAERAISTVMSLARAMMHHAALHWPDVSDTALWPLAVLHAVHIVNNIPRSDSGRSPKEIFTKKALPASKLQDLHVWGCPVYVLEKTLADGMKLPRWRSRSNRCVYVGVSPQHSSQAARVLSLETGKITTQYHVVFDDWFQTVGTSDADLPDFNQEAWYQTFGTTEWQYVPEDGDPDPSYEPVSGYYEVAVQQQDATRLAQEREPTGHLSLNPSSPAPNVPASEAAPSPASSQQRENNTVQTPVKTPVSLEQPSSPNTVAETATATSSSSISVPKVESPARTYADATKTPPANPVATPTKPKPSSSPTPTRTSRRKAGLAPEFELDHNIRYARTNEGDPEEQHWEQLYVYLCTGRETTDPTLFVNQAKKVKRDPDTYNWDEAMASPFKDKFLEAADVELRELGIKDTWVEDLIMNANKVIPSQWVFRIKRTPDGEIKKFKGRIVYRGDLAEADGETFSPVAAWSTVRSFFVYCLVRGWIAITIDFSNAFVQSPLTSPVWMHLPRGYRSTKGPGYCLRLKKSIYGLSTAPRLWFNYVTKAFKELGLKQSEHDPCLWYGKDLILVMYVDDCGIGAPNQEIIDEFVAALRAKGLELTQEGSFSEFLGIKFEKLADGSYELTQKGLIKKILTAANMTNCNPASLPASQDALGSDVDGEPMDEKWNYRAIVGMLLYLATNTRIDISLAVSQVARFGANPKKSHAKAVKMILRYLKKTMDKGIIISPKSWLELDLYVDADFCGLFKREDDRDSSSVKSRTGYVITLAGCPVVWKSALQSAVCQSTLESEYHALSDALKTFLPVKRLIQELLHKTGDTSLEGATVRATVFEDNQSCYFLATNQRITNRTRHFLAKWHWFWEHYNAGEFDIVKCPTTEQRADYLTKQLPKEPFESNRLALQGW